MSGRDSLFTDTRCEACELEAARMAYAAGLGASEWEAFVHRVPRCPDCDRVVALLGLLAKPGTPLARAVWQPEPHPLPCANPPCSRPSASSLLEWPA